MRAHLRVQLIADKNLGSPATCTSNQVSALSRILYPQYLTDAAAYVGPMTILPLRRLFIERQVQPEMLSFTSTEEVVDLFNMYVIITIAKSIRTFKFDTKDTLST